jgi:hypothetical protein
MRETVANEAQLALLDVLLDWIERLLFADLHFGVSPARDFDYHIEDTIRLISVEWDIVEGGNDAAVVLEEYTML